MSKSSFFRALRWTVVDKLLTRLISTFVFFFMASQLEPADFGLVAIAALFGELMRPLIHEGFSMALVQREKLDELHRTSAFWVSLVTGIFIAILAFYLAEPIAYAFEKFASLRNETDVEGGAGYEVIAEIIRWLSIGFLVSPAAGVPTAILKRKMDFKSLAIRNLIANLAGGFVGVTMILLGFGIWSLVGARLCTAISGATALYVLGDWYPSFQFSFRHAWELMSFGISVTGKGILNFFNRQTDVLLIGLFLGATALGIYSIAYRLFKQFSMFLNGSVAGVTFPKFSRLQNDEPQLVDAFFKSTQFSAIVSFPFFFGTAAVADDFIPLLGSQWIPCIPILQVLSVVGVIHSVILFHGNIMMSRGKPHINLVLSLINTVSNIAAFAISVQWGIMAVASAFALRSVLMFPVGVKFTKKTLKFSELDYYSLLVPPLIASGCMAVLVLVFDQLLPDETGHLMSLVLKIVVGAIAYPAVIRICWPRLFSEVLDVFRKVIPVSAKVAQT